MRNPEPATTAWRDRILERVLLPPGELLANPRNVRLHPPAQAALLERALDALGWLRPCLVNRRSGHLLDGHLRAERARQRGIEAIPVDICDLDPDEERLVLATFDQIGALAVADQERLDALLVEARALEIMEPSTGGSARDGDDTAYGETPAERAALLHSGDRRVLAIHLTPEEHADFLEQTDTLLRRLDPKLGLVSRADVVRHVLAEFVAEHPDD